MLPVVCIGGVQYIGVEEQSISWLQLYMDQWTELLYLPHPLQICLQLIAHLLMIHPPHQVGSRQNLMKNTREQLKMQRKWLYVKYKHLLVG